MYNIGKKIRIVLIPKSENINELRDWDLWGPLLFCLFLALTLSFTSRDDQAALVFSGIFTIIWFGASLVTLNAQLLQTNLTFFQSICLLGYCMVPQIFSSLLFCFISYWALRIPIALGMWVWSSGAATFFVGVSVKSDKRLLVILPIVLLYLLLTWTVLSQKSIFSIDRFILNLFKTS